MNSNEIVATIEELVVRVNAVEKKLAALLTSAASAKENNVE